jgi:hypothetical protein
MECRGDVLHQLYGFSGTLRKDVCDDSAGTHTTLYTYIYLVSDNMSILTTIYSQGVVFF